MFICRPAILGLFLAVLLLLRCTVGASAQRVTTLEELKAAFLFNFTKFTDWPTDALPAAAPLVICVAADTRIEHALQVLTTSAVVSGHPVTVRAVGLEAALTPCHLLYVDNLDSKQTLRLLKKLGGPPC